MTAMASALAKVLLRLYPVSFRREMGPQILEDVRRRADELGASVSRVRCALWLPRLFVSLITNAVGAWGEHWTSTRAPRGRGTSGFSWLDVKLGVRMLAKYPGMTLTAGLGIAVGIAASGGFFAFSYAFFYPTIPLDEGHRLVALENWDLERNNEERRSMWDYFAWRDEMRSVEDMTAFHAIPRNLILGDGSAELVQIAEITPSGFELARVPPLLGRTLVEGDQARDAPAVLVIGRDVWQARFAGDPAIIGRDVRIGPVVHTIVGVMPEGFHFPMAYSYWTPLRIHRDDYGRGEGPPVYISGRLAPGYELDDARAELDLIGERMARVYPDTHARFSARAMRYILPLVDINETGGEGHATQLGAMNATISLLLVVIALNVAVLVYARTATRRGEIAVRTALGAGRGRIVTQLFAEALVLSTLSALVGLGLARIGMTLGNRILETEMPGTPFWLDLGIPGPALVYLAGLTVLAAAIMGVLPALQATGKPVQSNLARFHSGTAPRLGRTWTALIVAQVSIAVVALPAAVVSGWWEVRHAITRPTFQIGDFLTAYIAPDTEEPAGTDQAAAQERAAEQLARVREELARRLDAEVRVAAYAFGPDGIGSGPRTRVFLEQDADASRATDGLVAEESRVEPGFFEMASITSVSGRVLGAGDGGAQARPVVVVNRTLARRVGGDVLGRRMRIASPDGGRVHTDGAERWYEIVGVVEDLFENRLEPELVDARIYRLPSEAATQGTRVTIRMAGVDPAAYTQSLRDVMAGIDPTIRILPAPLSSNFEQENLALALVALVVILIDLSVLLLSAAGIYAMMSFAVSQRRREIGIRTALGARRRTLLGGIFGRAIKQLALGVGVGVVVAVAMDQASQGELLRGWGPPLLGGMVLVMVAVGSLAALGPARVGLSIEPMEALREG